LENNVCGGSTKWRKIGLFLSEGKVADNGYVHPKAVMWNEEMEKIHYQLSDKSKQRGRQNWLNRQEVVHGKL